MKSGFVAILGRPNAGKSTLLNVLTGEFVMLGGAGLRIEIVASTDRRVERLRVFPPPADETLPS